MVTLFVIISITLVPCVLILKMHFFLKLVFFNHFKSLSFETVKDNINYRKEGALYSRKE